MKFLKNESGSIIVFFTITVVLLLIMVGLGLDSGWLAYTRSQGQPAVDAAALAGASAVPTGSATEIQNPSGHDRQPGVGCPRRHCG